ncbi:MAG: hypothetical protein CMJ48_11980 [Planctomycetaceae bacterium]|nr:hypothetical protein [Planctomycetaceae bacterium]
MTPELNRRWMSGRAPFDGSIVVSCDDPELSLVRDALSFACEHLRSNDPNIFVFRDWHEHDGYVVEPQIGNWDDFASQLSTTISLYESRDFDVSVRVAVAPESFDWLLRYNIEDADRDYRDAVCDVDFCCSPRTSVSGLVEKLHSKWPEHMAVSAAKACFDHSYGG